MRTSPLTIILSLGALVGAAPGCARGSAQADVSEETPRIADATEDGAIRIAPESRAFVQSVVLGRSDEPTLLQAPARVAFRDGAIAQLGAPVAGRVSEVHVRVGELVAQGTPLVTLRSPDAAASRAQLAATRAALEGALVEAQRAARMLESGVGTDRERRAADLEVARLEIECARARTDASLLGRGRGGDVVLRAPFAGTVLSRRAAVGLAVEPGGEPLVELGDPAGIGVVVEVFDRDAGAVNVGAPVEVRVGASETPLRGRVSYLAPVVSSGTRTVPVHVELEHVDPSLRPGTFGRATITLSHGGLFLPTTALVLRDGRRTVAYLDRDGAYEQREVRARPAVDGRVQVLEGLAEGDRVVVAGALLLDGAADLLL